EAAYGFTDFGKGFAHVRFSRFGLASMAGQCRIRSGTRLNNVVPGQTGTQEKTSTETYNGNRFGLMAGRKSLTIVSPVHPSDRWSERTGRDGLKRNISFLRTQNICPETSLAESEHKKPTIGATLSAVMLLSRSTLSFASGVSAGMLSVIRLHANGATQF